MHSNVTIILLYLLIINVVCSKKSRIVGGTNTDITLYPYTASFRIVSDSQLFCAGAIISNQHILTAAHCFDNLLISQIGVFIGTTSSTNYTIPYYRICYVNAHPKYDPHKGMQIKAKYDIAVVLLTLRIVFDQFQNQIRLPKHDVKVGEAGVLTGWGRVGYPVGDLSDVLQMATMNIVSNPDCQKYVPFKIYFSQLCAFQRQGIGACHGDSGAPLVINGVIVGVSSFVHPCALGEPDVYMRVYANLQFIKSSLSCDIQQCCTSL